MQREKTEDGNDEQRPDDRKKLSMVRWRIYRIELEKDILEKIDNKNISKPLNLNSYTWLLGSI